MISESGSVDRKLERMSQSVIYICYVIKIINYEKCQKNLIFIITVLKN